jgi:hypothetical protein
LYGYASEDPINVADPSGLGGACQRVKKKAKNALKQKTSTVPLAKGPGFQVDMHTDKPAVSVTTGVGVEVDGQKVGEVTATGTVGVTQTESPRAPLFYVDGEGNIVILGYTVWHGSVHKEVVNPNDWRTTKDLDKESNRAEGVTCTDPTDHCSGTPYNAP